MSDPKLQSDDGGDPGALDDAAFEVAALERANAAISVLKDVYVREWAPASLSEMYESLALAQTDRLARRENLDRLYRLAHDMKGQGGTFGYPLLTELGEAVCRLTADRDDASEGEFTLLRAHVDAARVIILERLEGDGGQAGGQLLAELRAMLRTHLH